jgi:hypothetical protein
MTLNEIRHSDLYDLLNYLKNCDGVSVTDLRAALTNSLEHIIRQEEQIEKLQRNIDFLNQQWL